MNTITIDLPLYVMLPRKKKSDFKFILNLNNYRNTHYRTLAEAKLVYSGFIASRLAPYRDMGIDWPVILRYTLWMGTKTHVDAANVGSVIDKFTSDAMVEMGILKDDRMTIVKEVRYRYGGVDREDPRMVLEIIDYID